MDLPAAPPLPLSDLGVLFNTSIALYISMTYCNIRESEVCGLNRRLQTVEAPLDYNCRTKKKPEHELSSRALNIICRKEGINKNALKLRMVF